MKKNMPTKPSIAPTPMPASPALSEAAAAVNTDLETRLTEQHHVSLRLWLRMLSSTVKVETEIRTRLRNEFEITLPRFDLMAQLERHPDGLRMGELSKRMMVSGGNITTIANQLAKEKLAERVTDPDDRRSYSLKLTALGLTEFVKMAQVHERWVEQLLHCLDNSEKHQLMELLSKVKASL